MSHTALFFLAQLWVGTSFLIVYQFHLKNSRIFDVAQRLFSQNKRNTNLSACDRLWNMLCHNHQSAEIPSYKVIEATVWTVITFGHLTKCSPMKSSKSNTKIPVATIFFWGILVTIYQPTFTAYLNSSSASRNNCNRHRKGSKRSLKMFTNFLFSITRWCCQFSNGLFAVSSSMKP